MRSFYSLHIPSCKLLLSVLKVRVSSLHGRYQPRSQVSLMYARFPATIWEMTLRNLVSRVLSYSSPPPPLPPEPREGTSRRGPWERIWSLFSLAGKTADNLPCSISSNLLSGRNKVRSQQGGESRWSPILLAKGRRSKQIKF